MATAQSSRFVFCFFFFSSRRRHTRFKCDWSSDVCSSDLILLMVLRHECHEQDSGKLRAAPPPPYPPRLAGEDREGAVGLCFRSEERRVGKEGRSRWSPYH